MDPIYRFGIALIQEMQTMSPGVDGVMKFISFLGTLEFYLILVPLVYWVFDPGLGFRILVVLISTDFFGTTLKQLLHQPRPFWIGGVKGLSEEASYGIPSLHLSNSFALWGTLAYRMKKGWLWAVAVMLVFLIGFSRMHLGVHFPTDVLAGWLLGLAAIVIFSGFERWVTPRVEQLPDTGQIISGFILSLLIILVGWVVRSVIAAFPDPPEWAGYALHARDFSRYFTLAGGLFGTLAGYVCMRRSARFQTQGSGGQRVVRYLVGISSMLLIYLLLDVSFAMVAADETAAGLVLRYVRYSLVTFWALFGAPKLFLKLRLAKQTG